MYSITTYTRRQARRLGVTVKSSTRKNKKIDVFKNGKKVASVGFLGMNDFQKYVQEKGLSYANKKKILYKKRHQKDRTKVGSAGYYADQLLW